MTEQMFKQSCESFALNHSTPNVRAAMDRAYDGSLRWADVYRQFVRAGLAVLGSR